MDPSGKDYLHLYSGRKRYPVTLSLDISNNKTRDSVIIRVLLEQDDRDILRWLGKKTREEQSEILARAKVIMAATRGLGATGALELIKSVERYIDRNTRKRR